MRALLLFFLFSSKIFSHQTQEKENFFKSYEKFHKILERDPKIKEVSEDIILFLEAKRDFYQGNNASNHWKDLFKTKKSHMRDNFAESWAFMHQRTSLETPVILRKAQDYNIFDEVYPLFSSKKKALKEEISHLKAIRNFIKKQSLVEHIPLSPDSELSLESIEKKKKKSLLYEVLLVIAYDHKRMQDETLLASNEALKKLQKDTTFGYLSLPLHQIRARILRHTGKREEAANEYEKLQDIWTSLSAHEFPEGITRGKRELAKTNDFLWSARYQALVGKKEKAIQATEKALEFIESLRKKKITWDEELEAREYIFEAHYIRSFRIGLNYGDYSDGKWWAEKALTDYKKILSRKWEDHFNWVLGFSYFLLEEPKKAFKVWSSFSKKSHGRSSHPKRLFWLQKTAKILKKMKEHEKYKKALFKKHPFSYYSLVELNHIPKAKLKKAAKEKNKNTNQKKTRNKSRLLVSLIRAEVLIESELFELAQGEVNQAYFLTKPRKFTKKNINFYLYMAKLMDRAKLYPKSILLVEGLSRYHKNLWKDHPEALPLYYPQAFKQNFEKASKWFSLSLPLLYSIGRRESVFNPKALSFANAIGLMQMTPKTAERIAAHLEINKPIKEAELYDVDHSLFFSSSYLKNLNDLYENKPFEYIAAYNAGEYCVDQWKKIIKEKDPLLFIELMPFSETRKYTKNIMASMTLYRELLWASESKKTSLLKYTKKHFSL